MDNLGSSEIGLNDSFKFHCTQCGKCCIHREDILLNPKDIYNMSKESGISTEELFKKYCEAYVGDDSRVHIVRIRPKGSVKASSLCDVPNWQIFAGGRCRGEYQGSYHG